MKEYDVVKLIKKFDNLEIGTEGTIVHEYSNGEFEVEFFDADDDTIGVYTVSPDYLMLVIEYK